MSNAIAGLLGGVVGALVSALAVVLGPLAHQRQLARQERERADREASRNQLQRVARARTAIREWHAFLDGVFSDIEAGRPLDAERFIAEVTAVRKEARAASDELLGGRLWIGSRQFGAFDEVTRQLRAHLGAGTGGEGRTSPEQRRLRDRVTHWRGALHDSRAELNEDLLSYVDQLQDTPVQVIDRAGRFRSPRT
ncbi:hypothetical protein ACYF6T_42560 [Streptomyces sp. 7R007]